MKLFRSIQAFGTCRFPDVLIEQLTEDPSLLKLGIWDPGEIEVSVLSADDIGDAIEVDIVVSCCPAQGAGCCATGPDVDQVKRIHLKIDKAQGCAIGFERD
jgi:hypothetical protein